MPTDVAIFSAAVSDFKISKRKRNKKLKKKIIINLNFEKNIDILSYVSNHNSLRPKLVIGFAAETNNVKNNAKKNYTEKTVIGLLQMMFLINLLAFNSDFNEVTIFYKNKEINDEKLNMKKKSEISDEIVDRVINQLN